jgi:transposase-like protein
MKRTKLLTKIEKDCIIEEYLNTEISSRELARRNGISQASVLTWVKEKDRVMGNKTSKKETKLKTDFPETRVSDPLLEIKRLKRKLEELELEKEFYKEIVNLAEKELGINLKKNSGKKQ